MALQIGSALEALGGGLSDWAKSREEQRSRIALEALRQSQQDMTREYHQGRLAEQQRWDTDRATNLTSMEQARQDAATQRGTNELRQSFPGVQANYAAINAMSPITENTLTSGPLPALGALRQSAQATTTTPASQLFSQRAAAATDAQRATGNPQTFTVGGETGYVPGKEFAPNQELGPADYAARAGASERARLQAQKDFGVLHQPTDVAERERQQQRQAELNARFQSYSAPRQDPKNPFGPKVPGLPPDQAMQAAQQDVDLLYPRASTTQPGAMATPTPSMLGAMRGAGTAMGALTPGGVGEGVDQAGATSTGSSQQPASRLTGTSAPSPGVARSPGSGRTAAPQSQRPDFGTRKAQLQQQGVSRDSARAQLISEGYLSPDGMSVLGTPSVSP